MSAFSEVLERQRDNDQPPPQRCPPVVRTAIQLCVVPFVVLEQAVRNVVQLVLRPAYKRGGSCKKTGACCRVIVARVTPLENRIPYLARVMSWWAQEVNGFFPRAVDLQLEEGDDVRVYACRHLTSSGTCKSYWSRPTVCRAWPARDWFGEPTVLKGCGYKFVARDGTEAAKKARKLPVVDDV